MTIPASTIVSVTPSVVSAGGSALNLNSLFLTGNTRSPIGQVLSFPTAAAVGAYFGLSSTEYAAAGIYFLGFDNSNIKPGALLFYQFNTVNVAAYLRGGSVSGLTLAQLQSLSGTLAVTIDGTPYSAAVNLSAATSQSNAASIAGQALGIKGASVAVVTGSIATTTLTVSAVTSGTVSPACVISGTGVTANTYIISQLTGTPGGVGTYQVSTSQTAASTAVTAYAPAVTYDSTAGAFTITSSTSGASSTIAYATGAMATSLNLTAALGAVVSPGAVSATPATVMAAVTALNTNFATFTTLFDPDTSGNVNKLAFAAWNNTYGLNDFMYVSWDTDATPTTTVPATASLAYLITAAGLSGTYIHYGSDYTKAAFICGAVASIDTTQHEGRSTLAFKAQAGLSADVTNPTIAANLKANGYNFYGAYATANSQFSFEYPGAISGMFKWADTYINQIWLNNSLQLALITLLRSVKSIPYTSAGYSLVRAACTDPIDQALNFGAIRAGVPLSALQAAEVNNAAGTQIDNILSSRGWYLQILPATAQTRAARQSPPISLWYMDGQSVQQINVASIEVQ